MITSFESIYSSCDIKIEIFYNSGYNHSLKPHLKHTIYKYNPKYNIATETRRRLFSTEYTESSGRGHKCATSLVVVISIIVDSIFPFYFNHKSLNSVLSYGYTLLMKTNKFKPSLSTRMILNNIQLPLLDNIQLIYAGTGKPPQMTTQQTCSYLFSK